jgi:hypothetical protein
MATERDTFDHAHAELQLAKCALQRAAGYLKKCGSSDEQDIDRAESMAAEIESLQESVMTTRNLT